MDSVSRATHAAEVHVERPKVPHSGLGSEGTEVAGQPPVAALLRVDTTCTDVTTSAAAAAAARRKSLLLTQDQRSRNK